MNAPLRRFFVRLFAIVSATATVAAADKIKVLIVDGQNNHDWRACTPVMQRILEDTGRFVVDVTTTPPAAPRAPRAPRASASADEKAAHALAMARWPREKEAFDRTIADQWAQWRPRFAAYDVVLSNYNGDAWPEPVRVDFEQFVRQGGGLVIVHAADNAFPDWPEYNLMIGIGGWGGRNEESGPMIRWRDGRMVRDDSPGAGGTHGPQHEFLIVTRAPDHPIMRGLPDQWLHVKDELYSKMRGPARNVTLLATAYADPNQGGTGEHEPMLLTITYGEGRVFHTMLGHGPEAMGGLGFQVTLARGTEWAASGEVTLEAPESDALTTDRAARHPGA